jgi:uncharacterized protein YdhG (YjbR/CyaY superfamily)
MDPIDAYIAAAPEPSRAHLKRMRAIVRKAAPRAEELISYGMPAYKQDGVLVYFAGYKHHIGFYPTGSGIAAVKDELKGFKTSKGAIQFSLEAALPTALITRIVKHRVRENLAKKAAKSSRIPFSP